eukprot:g501.t1
MAIPAITSVEQYDKESKDGRLMVVDLHRSWCGPCSVIQETFSRLERDIQAASARVFFRTMDIDKIQIDSLAEHLPEEKSVVPKFLLIHNGVVKNSVVGCSPPNVEESIVADVNKIFVLKMEMDLNRLKEELTKLREKVEADDEKRTEKSSEIVSMKLEMKQLYDDHVKLKSMHQELRSEHQQLRNDFGSLSSSISQSNTSHVTEELDGDLSKATAKLDSEDVKAEDIILENIEDKKDRKSVKVEEKEEEKEGIAKENVNVSDTSDLIGQDYRMAFSWIIAIGATGLLPLLFYFSCQWFSAFQNMVAAYQQYVENTPWCPYNTSMYPSYRGNLYYSCNPSLDMREGLWSIPVWLPVPWPTNTIPVWSGATSNNKSISGGYGRSGNISFFLSREAALNLSKTISSNKTHSAFGLPNVLDLRDYYRLQALQRYEEKYVADNYPSLLQGLIIIETFLSSQIFYRVARISFVDIVTLKTTFWEFSSGFLTALIVFLAFFVETLSGNEFVNGSQVLAENREEFPFSLRLGRSKSSDILIDEVAVGEEAAKHVSRNHATLHVRKSDDNDNEDDLNNNDEHVQKNISLFIQDGCSQSLKNGKTRWVKSSVGTWVNGDKLDNKTKEQRKVLDGDIITLGKLVKLKIVYHGKNRSNESKEKNLSKDSNRSNKSSSNSNSNSTSQGLNASKVTKGESQMNVTKTNTITEPKKSPKRTNPLTKKKGQNNTSHVTKIDTTTTTTLNVQQQEEEEEEEEEEREANNGNENQEDNGNVEISEEDDSEQDSDEESDEGSEDEMVYPVGGWIRRGGEMDTEKDGTEEKKDGDESSTTTRVVDKNAESTVSLKETEGVVDNLLHEQNLSEDDIRCMDPIEYYEKRCETGWIKSHVVAKVKERTFRSKAKYGEEAIITQLIVLSHNEDQINRQATGQINDRQTNGQTNGQTEEKDKENNRVVQVDPSSRAKKRKGKVFRKHNVPQAGNNGLVLSSLKSNSLTSLTLEMQRLKQSRREEERLQKMAEHLLWQDNPTGRGRYFVGRWRAISSGEYTETDWPCASYVTDFQVDEDATSLQISVNWYALRTRLLITIKEKVNGIDVITNTQDARSTSSAAVYETIWTGKTVQFPFTSPKPVTNVIKLDINGDKGLQHGKIYTLTIRKLTSAMPFAPGVGNIFLKPSLWRLYSVKVTTGGSLLVPKNAQEEPKPRRRRIEFIGASDTAGYCVDGTPKQSSITSVLSGWKFDNCAKANPGNLGDLFDADISVEAIAGIGLTQNANAKQSWQMGKATMPTYYKKVLQSDHTNKLGMYNFTFHPDLVVISLGGNDFNHQNGDTPNVDTFVQSYINFMNFIFTKYPETRIVSICGQGSPEESKSDPDNNRCRPCPTVEKAVATFQSETQEKNADQVAYIFVPCDGTVVTGEADIGCMGHKNQLGQSEVSKFLYPKIKSFMQW